MVGYLITNKYFVSEHLSILCELFIKSAKKHNIELLHYNNVELMKILLKNSFVKPDFVLFWDKDIKLAKYLENVGVRVYNSAESIRICDDKALTYLNLINVNVAMPKSIFSPHIYYDDLSNDEEFIRYIEEFLKYPMVFKECFGSFGRQVFLINERKELVSHMKEVGTRPFIVQEYIKESFGRDLRVYIVGDKVVGTMLRQNQNGDFRANIEIGGIGKPYIVNDMQKDMAIKVVKKLGLDFAGVDILFGKDDMPILCEVNSNAYFTGIDKVLNINIEDYIIEYIIGGV